MFLLLASLVWGACTSDDENAGEGNGNDNGNGNGNGQKLTYVTTPQEEPPVWQMDWSYNQERPNWQGPDASLFSTWTFVMVQIEDALKPYVSNDDMMAIFADEYMCGLARPAISVGGSDKVNTRFLMKIGNADIGPESYTVRLQYYCKKLNHIFTLSEKVNMDTDLTLGIDEEYVPEFTLGSAKYPVVKTVTAESILASVGITPQRNGIMAAFVGDECRGVTQFVADPNLRSTELTIYGRTAGESVTLKYYDAVKRVVYTFADPVKM